MTIIIEVISEVKANLEKANLYCMVLKTPWQYYIKLRP